MANRIVVKFSEQPEVVIFDGPSGIEGKQVESTDGKPEWQHITDDDTRIFWLPEKAQQSLEASGAKKGDAVSIRKVRRGRVNDWIIEPCEDEPTQQPPAKQRLPNHSETLQPVASRESTARQLAPHPASNPQLARPQAQVLAMSLMCAIDAAIAGEEYAKAKGAHWAFSCDDIRSMAISVYINACNQAKEQTRR